MVTKSRSTMKSILGGLVFLLFLSAGRLAFGSSCKPVSVRRYAERAAAICRGTVVEMQSFKNPADSLIYTRTLVCPTETLKGRLPAVVQLIHRGGVLETEGDADGLAPDWRVGEERLFFLMRRRDGTLYTSPFRPPARQRNLLQDIRALYPSFGEAGDDVTDQSAVPNPSASPSPVTTTSVTGLLVDGSGISARYILPDRGEQVPVLIDAQTLPPGITLTQATNAVHNALQAWANVTTFQYTIEGLTNFGQAASTVTTNDGKLRIQLHDLYGAISGGEVLGIGGRAYSFNNTLFPGGGYGGRVTSNEFHLTTRGYVVLSHTETAMQTLSTFEEVLCHEVGHALSMAHSSENPSEPNTTLKQAIMYFEAHADGRGATLGSYDPPVIQQVFPPTNTPPYGYDRIVRCVTAFSPLSNPEVNQVEMKGYDLQGSTLTKTLINATANYGSFSLGGDTLTYTASGASGDSAPIDPASSSYYERTYVRFDDGTNASPPVLTRVLQFYFDGQPATPDGMPDSWMTNHFGSATPTPGVSGANDDADGDGITNLREFQGGTSPIDGNAAMKITQLVTNSFQFLARPYELYEPQTSTDLTTWTRLGNPVLPKTSTGVVSYVAAPIKQFFRVRKIP
jgi:hypothetical protein